MRSFDVKLAFWIGKQFFVHFQIINFINIATVILLFQLLGQLFLADIGDSRKFTFTPHYGLYEQEGVITINMVIIGRAITIKREIQKRNHNYINKTIAIFEYI